MDPTRSWGHHVDGSTCLANGTHTRRSLLLIAALCWNLCSRTRFVKTALHVSFVRGSLVTPLRSYAKPVSQTAQVVVPSSADSILRDSSPVRRIFLDICIWSRRNALLKTYDRKRPSPAFTKGLGHGDRGEWAHKMASVPKRHSINQEHVTCPRINDT